MKQAISKKLIIALTGFTSWQAYFAILGVLFACGLGLPLPEDITLIAAGVLVALKTIHWWGAMLVGFFGVLVGDAFLFFLGRRFGRRVFLLPGFKKIFTESVVKTAERRVAQNSKFICFTARFLPGLRAPIFLSAGILGVKPYVFLLLDGLAAMISVPFWVYVGIYFGENLDVAVKNAQKFQLYLFGAVIVFVSTYIFIKWRASKTSGPTKNQTEIM